MLNHRKLNLFLGAIILNIPLAHSALIYDSDTQKFDFFGNISAAFVNQNMYQEQINNTTNNNDSSIYAKAELGLALRSEITKGADAIAMALWETQKDNHGNEGSLNSTRYMFVGIDAYQYGTLMFGRGDGAYYTITGVSDIFNYIESNAHDYYRLGEQRPSQIMYSLRALSWDLKLSYLFSNDDIALTPLDIYNGYSFSVSTKFNDKLTFAYGFDYYKFDYRGSQNRLESELFFVPMLMADKNMSYAEAFYKSHGENIARKKDYGIAISYGNYGPNQGLYAALSLSASAYDYLAHHIYTLDGVISYSFKDKFSGLSLSANYGRQYYEDYTLVSDLNLAAQYALSPQFKVFIEGQIDLNGEADKFYGQKMANKWHLNENKIAIGAEFSF